MGSFEVGTNLLVGIEVEADDEFLPIDLDRSLALDSPRDFLDLTSFSVVSKLARLV